VPVSQKIWADQRCVSGLLKARQEQEQAGVEQHQRQAAGKNGRHLGATIMISKFLSIFFMAAIINT